MLSNLWLCTIRGVREIVKHPLPPAIHKNDPYILGLLVFVTAVSWYFWFFAGSAKPALVEIRGAKGQHIERHLPTSTTETIEIQGPLGTSVIEIDPTGARFISSPCPHEVCVRSGHLSHPGACSACVPNGVILIIRGDG